MKKRLLLLTFAILIVLLFMFPVQVFIIERDGTVIDSWMFRNEFDFSVQWQHSVEKEIWEEFFVIRDQQILMKSTRFKTFGAGVPSSAGKDTFIKDGWVYMVDINREIGNELAIRTGRSTHHQIQSQNKKVKLIPQTSYSVKVDTLQLAKAIFLMMK